MNRPLVIVLDDSQHVAGQCADWSGLEARAEVRFLSEAFASEAAVAAALVDAEIIIPTRERTVFGASLIGRLPKLRLLALTGGAPRRSISPPARRPA
ncbi:hypothetical protein [Bosea sp. 685]|uniref:hypothetical protein n=1 Tax=Bosea sp. 685 TaxID=3080057 RepID=UPI0028937446|nr:hypothetical protein [Bosea sp. 685]WNJ88982.1 hypothetical protein RMR04_21550 [Bosea sp. 685]